MAFNIDTVDKSDFVCLKLPNESVYWGDVNYLDD